MLVYIQMNCANNRFFNSPVALQLFYIWKIFFFVEKKILIYQNFVHFFFFTPNFGHLGLRY